MDYLKLAADRPWLTMLACPLCEECNLHMGKVRIVQGERVDEVWSTGSKTTTNANPEGRGSSVQIAMEGECGHAFILTIRFHKGTTFISAEQCRESVGHLDLDELWRD